MVRWEAFVIGKEEMHQHLGMIGILGIVMAS